jgi:hypothetical protein
MVCAAYAANVLENALATLGHEARERAFAQVDELLAEYSQWPFGKRVGGASGGAGANLGQVIADEVTNGKDKELQLEVRICHFLCYAHLHCLTTYRLWQRASASSQDSIPSSKHLIQHSYMISLREEATEETLLYCRNNWKDKPAFARTKIPRSTLRGSRFFFSNQPRRAWTE